MNIRYWTPFQDEVFRRRYPNEGPSESLAIALGRTKSAMVAHALTLGIKMSLPALREVRKYSSRRGINSSNFKGYGKIYGKYIYSVRRKAHQRKIECPLLDGSEENNQYLNSIASDVCPLSGMLLIYPRYIRDNTGTASLDRIDSSKGYIKGNVRWIHKDINEMKWAMTDEDFLSFVCDIAKVHPQS